MSIRKSAAAVPACLVLMLGGMGSASAADVSDDGFVEAPAYVEPPAPQRIVEASNEAYGIPCEGWVGTGTSVQNVTDVQGVTHKGVYTNDTYDKMTMTYTAKVEQVFTAGIEVSRGFKAEADGVVAKLSAEAGVKLSAAGSRTSGSQMGITATIRPKHTAVVGAGNTIVRGRFTQSRCTSGTGTVQTASGTGMSFAVAHTAAIDCRATPTSRLSRTLKARFC